METWLLRAGRHEKAIDKFRNQMRIAVGWNDLGNFPIDGDRDAFRAEVKKRHPEDTAQEIGAVAGQLWNFARVMKIGDNVITPAINAGEVLVGKITGDYL